MGETTRDLVVEERKRILRRIAALRKIITDDSRYQAKPALVQINAPLALIQVGMTAAVNAYDEIADIVSSGRKRKALAPTPQEKP